MIVLLYRGAGRRRQRSFRTVATAQVWCRLLLQEPIEVVEAFGFLVDADGNHIVPLSGCTVQDLTE